MCASNRKSDGAYGINSIFTVSLIKKHCIDMFLKLKMRSLAIFFLPYTYTYGFNVVQFFSFHINK